VHVSLALRREGGPHAQLYPVDFRIFGAPTTNDRPQRSAAAGAQALCSRSKPPIRACSKATTPCKPKRTSRAAFTLKLSPAADTLSSVAVALLSTSWPRVCIRRSCSPQSYLQTPAHSSTIRVPLLHPISGEHFVAAKAGFEQRSRSSCLCTVPFFCL